MNYATAYSSVVRYSRTDHHGFQQAILDASSARWKQRPPPRSEYDVFDPTHALVYADYLSEQGHPAEHVFRWWADSERQRLMEAMGQRGMFVGHSAAPVGEDGLSWSLGQGAKTKKFPSHPIIVHVGWSRPIDGGGTHWGRVYSPVTPDEADALADHIDQHYGEGRHPIAAALRQTAARHRRRKPR